MNDSEKLVLMKANEELKAWLDELADALEYIVEDPDNAQIVAQATLAKLNGRMLA